MKELATGVNVTGGSPLLQFSIDSYFPFLTLQQFGFLRILQTQNTAPVICFDCGRFPMDLYNTMSQFMQLKLVVSVGGVLYIGVSESAAVL